MKERTVRVLCPNGIHISPAGVMAKLLKKVSARAEIHRGGQSADASDIDALGKIYDYEPDYRILMNGQPCITLVVRYLMNGEISEARVNTGDVDVTRYPRGATIGIKLLAGQAALVPNSLSDTRIEQEDDLMNPDFDPSGMQSSIGVSCPNCGANITVPLGMSRFCPYCNTKVSVDAAGHVLG